GRRDAGQDEALAGDHVGALTERARGGPVLAGAAVNPAKVRARRAIPPGEKVIAADGRGAGPVLHAQRQGGPGNRGAGGDAQVAEGDHPPLDVAAAAGRLVHAELITVEGRGAIPSVVLAVLSGDVDVGRPGVTVDALLEGDGRGLSTGVV